MIHNGRTFAKTCSNKVFGCKKATDKVKKKGKFACGAALVSEVVTSDKRTLFYPLKVYTYRSLISSLKEIVMRQTFLRNCERSKLRQRERGVFSDLYDGYVWKEFERIDGKDFLARSNNYGVMLNVDWFQPYKRRKDLSVGALYLVFMNLPREVRFDKENVLLVGLIPPLSKEPSSLNTFLEPLVRELNELWDGVNLSTYDSAEPVLCRLALLCAAADIPAARKLCGFMGHSAKQGCSFCKVEFDYKGKVLYNVFEESECRSRAEHIICSEKAEKAATLTAKQQIEKECGYRYTCLLKLPYFEPSRFCVVDPMHNLFLGTAKKMFCKWVDLSFLSKQAFESIRTKISKLHVPSDVGKIPVSLEANYGSMTAKEWKNWVLIYSMYCLNGILPYDHLSVWQTFVLACKYLCQPLISEHDLDVAHRLLVKFCKEVEKLYGADFITPNMHLHCHLKQSVKDYGSVYAFWLFSFERFNGILADFPTNKKSIVIQIMRKFQEYAFVHELSKDDLGEFCDRFLSFVTKVDGKKEKLNSVFEKPFLNVVNLPVEAVSKNIWSELGMFDSQKQSYKCRTLIRSEKFQLLETYSIMYGQRFESEFLSDCIKVFRTVFINGELVGSESSDRSRDHSVIMARWADDRCYVSCGELRPGKVKFVISHVVQFPDGELKEHLFFVVDWFKVFNGNTSFRPPVSVWSKKTVNEGPATYLPVQRMKCRCAWTKSYVGHQPVVIVAPLPFSLYL